MYMNCAYLSVQYLPLLSVVSVVRKYMDCGLFFDALSFSRQLPPENKIEEILETD